ncbi:MAG: hypothetical protein KDH96_13300 [Candidatus Riesia sp.]|nr:hypothetical protein [Candidatus Riesia sp.]
MEKIISTNSARRKIARVYGVTDFNKVSVKDVGKLFHSVGGHSVEKKHSEKFWTPRREFLEKVMSK